MVKGSAGAYNMTENISFSNLAKNGSEFLIADNALDTLFSSENHKLTPI